MTSGNSARYPSLGGRTAFVTGGATGIGEAIVAALARQGTRVHFCDIAADAGARHAEALAAAGHDVSFHHVDVTDCDRLRDTLAGIEARNGAVDVLVNNAANDTRHDWREVTPEQWDRVMAINLRPMFFACQAVLPGMMQRRRGSIINFGSISWTAKFGAMPAYTTAKAAVHGLTRSFLTEAGKCAVRLNTVVPGWIMTERQLTLNLDEAGIALLERNQALADRIMPDDVAALVLFLAADDSARCSGQQFTVDGGWI
ncbi:MAG: SDR family oxidoreductase [Proteobacteria bacterium]|nr:SDR family oxidoreductase [Pseudomonadota bacterium]